MSDIRVDPRMKIGTSAKLLIGDAIFSVGFPIGGDRFASTGIVGNPRYSAPGTRWDNYVGLNIQGQPGSSGTNIVNEVGEVVSILVAGARGGDNLHLGTPIDLFLAQLEKALERQQRKAK